MGNTISINDPSDMRLREDTILGQEVKKILMNYEVEYKSKFIKPYVMKACCYNTLGNDNTSAVSLNPKQNAVVSVAFPRPLNPEDPSCKNNGLCLETYRLGLQIKDDPTKICSDKGLAGFSVDKSTCDKFMQNYCAKNLYEQGCIKIGKNKKNVDVPLFSTYEANKMCWFTSKGELQMSHGPPECACVNSYMGSNLNTWPSQKALDKDFGNNENPYGSHIMDDTNDFTKYSLNIFEAPDILQHPLMLDNTCSARSKSGNTSFGAAWSIANQKERPLTFCLNQINISNSDIKSANFKEVQQKNECGGPASKPQPPASDDLPLNPKPDPVKIAEEQEARKRAEEESRKKAEEDKKKAEEDKKKAEEVKKKAEEDKKKAEEDKKKAEEDKKKFEAEERAKLVAEEQRAKRARDELEALKKQMADKEAAEAIRRRAEEEALLLADNARKKAEEEAKIIADEANKKQLIVFGVGGSIGLIMIIIFVFLLLRNK
jgi:hypothetical protein